MDQSCVQREQGGPTEKSFENKNSRKLSSTRNERRQGPWTCGGHYLIRWTDSRAMMQAAVCSVSRGPMLDPTSRAGRLWTCPIAAEARPPPKLARRQEAQQRPLRRCSPEGYFLSIECLVFGSFSNGKVYYCIESIPCLYNLIVV